MEQNLCLEQLDGIPSFSEKVQGQDFCMTKPQLDIMQMNITNCCNLGCKHCHVNADPTHTKMMSRKIMKDCLQVFEENNFSVLDITGGSPEMNPDFQWLVEEASRKNIHTIVRSNLVILTEEGYTHFPDLYAKHKVEIVASLPYYSEKDTDRQRGNGVFKACIDMLKKLNKLGYGKTSDLVLNLVYNPGGAFLPPKQDSLTLEYKKKLMDKYEITFNQLYTITNNPIGRFGDFLVRSGNLKPYMNRLVSAFNPAALENMMCRNQFSVGIDGTLYDCDFNQARGWTIEGVHQIQDLKGKPITSRKIVFGNHCYACTAGSGSSCGGTTT
ncbi:arsenosugar biosynthesis radical SAM (seleno)protein ArsS [Clostridium scatologenes]|uniref:Radical SAM domain-containing protein n=1 Tax=Clostridium scatologenes TaxID=1548 RepID=A0A0E3JM48_CLOSL|nr:arsenosugar biosynthesis radical SAM (seleno)protein ArsS [Clostridium scatologenes]AKA67654.1 radical SAM domain-containing protein [Clostridium scatologenes]